MTTNPITPTDSMEHHHLDNIPQVDSIIFDMDGTLWDAVDSYAVIWNTTLDQEGIEHQVVTRHELVQLMGSYLDDILARLLPRPVDREALLKRLMENEATMMRSLGGKLYPGVKKVIGELSKHYKLFIVSNCGPHGLENFVAYTGLTGYFTDLLTHGATGLPKARNIERLVELYNLKRPVYAGDTQGDADQAAIAGVPMIWAAYGFGTVEHPDATIFSIKELPEAIRKINDSNR